jgi:PAS domain S-box-containing protein
MDSFLDRFEGRAAIYAAGLMSEQDREEFELVLEFNPDVRALVAGLLDLGAALVRHAPTPGIPLNPPPGLKDRVLAAVARRLQDQVVPGLVVTCPAGLVRWVNPAFTAMCGYELDELQGRKLGPILQGPATDQSAVGRIRQAVRTFRPVRERLVNYHKDGSPYLVEIDITPVSDDDGNPLWLVAREYELPAEAA